MNDKVRERKKRKRFRKSQTSFFTEFHVKPPKIHASTSPDPLGRRLYVCTKNTHSGVHASGWVWFGAATGGQVEELRGKNQISERTVTVSPHHTGEGLVLKSLEPLPVPVGDTTRTGDCHPRATENKNVPRRTQKKPKMTLFSEAPSPKHGPTDTTCNPTRLWGCPLTGGSHWERS